MGVVPEESDAGPDHRSAENSDFAEHGHSLKFEVVGKDGMSADVCEDGEGSGGDDGAANGEAVKAVSKVDGIAGADDDQDDENYKGDKGNERKMWDVAEKSESQMRVQVLEKGHAELGGVVALCLHGNKRDGDRGG